MPSSYVTSSGAADAHANRAGEYLEKANKATTFVESQQWIEMAKVEADLARTAVFSEAVKMFKDKRFI